MSSFDFKKSSNFYDEMLGNSGSVAKSKEEIATDNLVEIENQPFNAYSSEQLKLLSEDIKINGLMSPLVVHKIKDSQKYEILAGRNRFNACKKLGMTSIPCIVKEDLSKPQRDLILVNSNLMQRQTLLPSERAKAYKMQQDAYKELGIKNETSESLATMYKYLRLNNLFCELLEKVDSGELPFTIGYELSGLDLSTQNALVDYLYDEPKTKVTMALIEELREQEEQGNVDVKTIEDFVKRSKKGAPKIVRESDENNALLGGNDAPHEEIADKQLVIQIDEFKSGLRYASASVLREFILKNEIEIWHMYKELG